MMGLSFSTYPKKKGNRMIKITTRVPLLQYVKVMIRSKRKNTNGGGKEEGNITCVLNEGPDILDYPIIPYVTRLATQLGSR